MSYQTPLSKLADSLRITRNSMNHVNIVDETCTAANQRIEQLEEKLSGATQFTIAMAQELQEIMGDAEAAGCNNPMPGIKSVVEQWETFYQEQQLINEVSL